MRRHYPLYLLMLGLLACSDDTGPAQTSGGIQAEASSASIAIAAQPQHEVLDTFNVGTTVYVRSLAIEAATNRLWADLIVESGQ